MHHDTEHTHKKTLQPAKSGHGTGRGSHNEHGHHGHDHHAGHEHAHSHSCHEHHSHGQHAGDHARPVLVLRPTTGISGDMMVAGLARMCGADQTMIDSLITAIGLPELAPGCLTVDAFAHNDIAGWRCAVSLPHEHAHRTLADIRAIITASALAPEAKTLAEKAFTLVAEAEASVHGTTPEQVAFHEVGALDSILDTCLAAALFAQLAPAAFYCGSLPVCDGVITCAHGTLAAPAPAVLKLLHHVPVHGLASCGETITPTGLALIKAFSASFGGWPAMTVHDTAIVYGTRMFPGVPNGTIFACGALR